MRRLSIVRDMDPEEEEFAKVNGSDAGPISSPVRTNFICRCMPLIER